MSKSMQIEELQSLLQYIYENNSPFARPVKQVAAGRPVVKYVDPHIDMRTGAVFSVVLRRFGGLDVSFYTGNEFIECNVSLYDRIMHYLNTGEYIEAPKNQGYTCQT